jgi:hypothetical protein
MLVLEQVVTTSALCAPSARCKLMFVMRRQVPYTVAQFLVQGLAAEQVCDP